MKSLIFIGNPSNPDGAYTEVVADDGTKFYVRAVAYDGALEQALNEAGDHLLHLGDVVMSTHTPEES